MGANNVDAAGAMLMHVDEKEKKRMLNDCNFIGNLGRDPEVRYGQSGSAIAKLSLAVNERRKRGDEWEEHTEWVRVTCFGRTAENVGQYLSKGSKVFVKGRLQTTKYTDREGQERWSTEVVANVVRFLDSRQGQPDNGSRNNGNRGGDSSHSGGGGGATTGAGDDGFYDDDLPF